MEKDPPGKMRLGAVYEWVVLKADDDVSACIAACCNDPAHKCVVASFNHGGSVCADAGHNATVCCGLKSVKMPQTASPWKPSVVQTIYNPAAPTPVPPSPPPPPPPPPPPLPPANIYVAAVGTAFELTGLRLPDGRRGIRARYPNADPEINGVHTPAMTGWIQDKTTWVAPRKSPAPTEIVVTLPEWTRTDSTGNELQYQGGVGGACAHLDPPFGYWCSDRPNRTGASATQTHRSPSGVVYKDGHLLPHAPYTDPAGAIVHSCMGGAACWFTWMWEVDAATNGALTWTKGGFDAPSGVPLHSTREICARRCPRSMQGLQIIIVC